MAEDNSFLKDGYLYETVIQKDKQTDKYTKFRLFTDFDTQLNLHRSFTAKIFFQGYLVQLF